MDHSAHAISRWWNQELTDDRRAELIRLSVTTDELPAEYVVSLDSAGVYSPDDLRVPPLSAEAAPVFAFTADLLTFIDLKTPELTDQSSVRDFLAEHPLRPLHFGRAASFDEKLQQRIARDRESVPLDRLYRTYAAWCAENGRDRLRRNQFAIAVTDQLPANRIDDEGVIRLRGWTDIEADAVLVG